MALTTQQNGTTVGGNPNQVRASWFNDYKDVLTGVMNDQAVSLDYRPGSGTTPTLSLKGDGHGPLLKGFDTNGTTVVATLDHSGNLTISGALSSGAITATSFTGSGNITLTGSNTGVELGAKGSANTPFVDMNSSGFNNDFDVRLSASGGVNASNGQGSLNILAATLKRNGNTVWDSTNDGAGSGLDADTVDGVQLSALAQLSGATFTGTVNVSTGSLQKGGKNALVTDTTALTGKITAASSAPSSPATGDLWLDTSTVL